MEKPATPALVPDSGFSAVLMPSREKLLEAEAAVPGQVAEVIERHAVDARRAMNAVQTVGAALLRAQDVEPPHQAQRFQALLSEAERVARMLLVRWGINPEDRNNRWMSNAIEKAIIPHLPATPLTEAQADQLAQALALRSADLQAVGAYRQERIVDVAILKGVSELMRAQADFDFGRRKTLDADLERVRDEAVDAALNAMDMLCPPLAPPPERATFLSLLVQQAFTVMESAWRRNAVHASRALAPLNKDQLAAWRAANPEGFSLDPVLTTFQQNMARLLRLTAAARKADRRR